MPPGTPGDMSAAESYTEPEFPILGVQRTISVKEVNRFHDLEVAVSDNEFHEEPSIQHRNEREQQSRRPTGSYALKGYLLVALSSIVFGALTTALFRHSENKFGFQTETILFALGAVNVSLSAPPLLLLHFHLGMSFVLEEWNGVLLLLRGVAGSVSNFLFLQAVQRIPAGTAAALFSLRKVITVLLAGVTLGEAFDCLDMLSALMGVAGVAIIAEPQTIKTDDLALGREKGMGMIFALGSASCTSVALVTVRALGSSTSFLSPVLAMSLFALAMSFCIGGAEVADPLLHWKSGSGVVLLASLSYFCSACCLNLGLQRCRAGPAVLINSLDVPMVDIWAALLLGETPAKSGLAGTFLLVCAALVASLRHS